MTTELTSAISTEDPGRGSTRAPRLEPAYGEAPVCLPRLAGRRPGPHDGRSASQRTSCDTTRHTSSAANVLQLSENAIRAILETIDQRRAINHLRPHLSPAVLDTVRRISARGVPATSQRAATLERLHAQMIDAGTAEIFGRYSRGPRMFAFAARLTARDGTWRVTALVIPDR